MDVDYVMFPVPARMATPQIGSPATVRRIQAMRQWGVARADHDYTTARECVRSLSDTRTWTRCLRQLEDLPFEIHVEAGEELVDQPMMMHESGVLRQTVHALPGLHDPLLSGLLEVNVDDILSALLPHDPLSWHCVPRQAQHTWFVKQFSHHDGPAAPHARVVPPPPRAPILRRSCWEDRPDAEEAGMPPRRRSSLTVVVDVLDYPLGHRRCVTERWMPPPTTTGAVSAKHHWAMAALPLKKRPRLHG